MQYRTFFFSERLPLHEQFSVSEPRMKLRTTQRQGPAGTEFTLGRAAILLRESTYTIAAIECAYAREDVRVFRLSGADVRPRIIQVTLDGGQ